MTLRDVPGRSLSRHCPWVHLLPAHPVSLGFISVLSLKGFEEEMEVSYFTGAVAPCVLGQLLSDLPVSSLQGTSTPELPE